MKELGIVLLAILIVGVLFLIGCLICWGIGSLVCVVFEINYNWTFLHGLVVQLLFVCLYGLIK